MIAIIVLIDFCIVSALSIPVKEMIDKHRFPLLIAIKHHPVIMSISFVIVAILIVLSIYLHSITHFPYTKVGCI